MDTNTARLLKVWREKQGYTQEDAAALFNVTQATIHNWESEKIPIPLVHLGRLENLVGKQERLLRKEGKA